MSPLPSLNRARIAFAHDTFMAALSFPLSMYLRLGDFYYFYIGEYILAASFAFAAISAPILYGVNSLTNSVSSYPDPAVFAVDTVTISTQAYD